MSQFMRHMLEVQEPRSRSKPTCRRAPHRWRELSELLAEVVVFHEVGERVGWGLAPLNLLSQTAKELVEYVLELSLEKSPLRWRLPKLVLEREILRLRFSAKQGLRVEKPGNPIRVRAVMRMGHNVLLESK